MRDPDKILTKHGTPFTVVISRLMFAGYFLFAWLTLQYPIFPHSRLSHIWLIYLLIVYYLMERVYQFYRVKKIDLTYAFPLLLSIYFFNLFSMLLNAQTSYPIVNRAEHFLSFLLLSYVVWLFFLKYLPQDVWRKHPYYTSFIVLSITSFFGVFNELIELLFDAILKTDLIGYRLDTSLDLLMNTLGSGLFLAVWLIIYHRDEIPDKVRPDENRG